MITSPFLSFSVLVPYLALNIVACLDEQKIKDAYVHVDNISWYKLNHINGFLTLKSFTIGQCKVGNSKKIEQSFLIDYGFMHPPAHWEDK